MKRIEYILSSGLIVPALFAVNAYAESPREQPTRARPHSLLEAHLSRTNRINHPSNKIASVRRTLIRWNVMAGPSSPMLALPAVREQKTATRQAPARTPAAARSRGASVVWDFRSGG